LSLQDPFWLCDRVSRIPTVVVDIVDHGARKRAPGTGTRQTSMLSVTCVLLPIACNSYPYPVPPFCLIQNKSAERSRRSGDPVGLSPADSSKSKLQVQDVILNDASSRCQCQSCFSHVVMPNGASSRCQCQSCFSHVVMPNGASSKCQCQSCFSHVVMPNGASSSCHSPMSVKDVTLSCLRR